MNNEPVLMFAFADDYPALLQQNRHTQITDLGFDIIALGHPEIVPGRPLAILTDSIDHTRYPAHF